MGRTIPVRAVTVATDGFEAGTRLRTKYLGRVWASAAVRGMPYSTGHCLETALDAPSLVSPPR